MSNLSWEGWSKKNLTTYSSKIGGGSSWATTDKNTGGTIGGASIFLATLKVPTVFNNIAITEYGGFSIKLACTTSGDASSFRAYLFESAPSGSTPASWRNWINTNSNIKAISDAPIVASDSNYKYYEFRFSGIRAEKNKTYYVCVATSDASSTSRLVLINHTWYPEVWVEISTTPLKLTYHQFGGDEIVSYEQVAGSYKALNPSNQSWGGKLLKDVWKNNNAYFVEWSTKASNRTTRSTGDRIAAGATFTFVTDMDLYPMGALIEDFNTEVAEGETEKKILLAPYYGNYQYALESNVSSKSDSVGVAFDVLKGLVTNNDLRHRLLYVHQDAAWHLLNGPYKSDRGDAYLTYTMSGRGTGNKKFYNASLSSYNIRMIMLDDRSIDLGNESDWPSGDWYYPNYRDKFSKQAIIADSELKGLNSLTSAQYQSLILPVYKIELLTHPEGVTDVARAGCSSASNYWITSVDTSECQSYFTYPECLLGLKSSSLSPQSSNLISATSMINWVENNDGYILASPDITPSAIDVTLWQKYNKGNLSNNAIRSNEYNVIYEKNNINIKINDTNYSATFIWVGRLSYLFACQTTVSTNQDKQIQINEINIRPSGFLYWRYNNKQYASLSSLADNAFNELLADNAPVIEAVVGDSLGFAYIKNEDTTLRQGYVYIKQDDNTLVRCTPYQKSWGYQLTPLILNANGVALT